MVSLMEPGDRALVVDTGVFGKRFALMVQLHGAKADLLSFPEGKHVDPATVEEKISREDYRALFVTHVDTSTTVINPLSKVLAAAKRRDILTVVDSVCGVGGSEFDFDGLGCDIALTASQKALAAPPGATLIVLSDRALATMRNRKSEIPSYYLSLTRWKKVMDNPTEYVATPATPIVLALREALLMVKEEGLEERWHRHHRIASAMRDGFELLGLEFIAEPGYRADTVTGVHMQGDKARDVQNLLREKFRVHVALGAGDMRGRALRIGHMGLFSPANALTTISAFESVLKDRGAAPSSAVGATLQRLEEDAQSA